MDEEKRSHHNYRDRQFPYMAKRRKHTLGNGLKAEYPEPQGKNIVKIEPAKFISNPPVSDPWKQAAMLRRYDLYGDTYKKVNDALPKGERWQEWMCPSEGSLSTLTNAACALWDKFLEQSVDPVICLAITTGMLGGYYLDNVYVNDTVREVAPEWTGDDERRQAAQCISGVNGWQTTCSFLEGRFVRPLQVATENGDGSGQTQEQVFPAVTKSLAFYSPEAGKQYSIAGRAIQLLIWGKYRLQGSPVSFPQMVGGLPDDPEYLEFEWGQLWEAQITRALWQMAWVEALIQERGILNKATGGRGGLVGEEGSDRPVNGGEPGPDVGSNSTPDESESDDDGD